MLDAEKKGNLSHSMITLEINHKISSFSQVWVHLKEECRLKQAPFKITVDRSQLKAIFDPYDTKPATLTWREFTQDQIDSFGTFILAAYIKTMAQITNQEEPAYEWVIAKIETISEKKEALEIIGCAEQFNATAY